MAYEIPPHPLPVGSWRLRLAGGARRTGEHLSLGGCQRRGALLRSTATRRRKSRLAAGAVLHRDAGVAIRQGIASSCANAGSRADLIVHKQLQHYGAETGADLHQHDGSYRARNRSQWRGSQAAVRRWRVSEGAGRRIPGNADCSWQSYRNGDFLHRRRWRAVSNRAGHVLCAATLRPAQATRQKIAGSIPRVQRGG